MGTEGMRLMKAIGLEIRIRAEMAKENEGS